MTMNTTLNVPLTRADLVERAAALRPLFAANAERTDRERKVPQENIDALADAGLLGLMQPVRLDGLETDFRTLLEVGREVGRACGSTCVSRRSRKRSCRARRARAK